MDYYTEDIRNSFSRLGQLSPILLREHPSEKGRYQVVFGNRRLDAAKKLGWETIIARVLRLSDADALILALSENLDRRDLSDYEKATFLEKFHSITGKPYGEIAERIGRSAAFVSQHLAMLHLFPETVAPEEDRKKVLISLTEKHARALLKVKNDIERWNTAKLVVSGNLGVREAERLCVESTRTKSTKNTRSDYELIQELIIDIVSGFCSKDITPLFNSVSERHFTMFPSLAPLTRLDCNAAKNYLCRILAEMDDFKERLEDVDIRVCKKFAYATMVILYTIDIAGSSIMSKIRTTLIFEKEEESWRVVHGHWSSVDTSVIAAVQSIAPVGTTSHKRRNQPTLPLH